MIYLVILLILFFVIVFGLFTFMGGLFAHDDDAMIFGAIVALASLTAMGVTILTQRFAEYVSQVMLNL